MNINKLINFDKMTKNAKIIKGKVLKCWIMKKDMKIY